MDQESRDVLEAKVEEHSLQIQQLHDEVDFKKGSITVFAKFSDNKRLADLARPCQ